MDENWRHVFDVSKMRVIGQYLTHIVGEGADRWIPAGRRELESDAARGGVGQAPVGARIS